MVAAKTMVADSAAQANAARASVPNGQSASLSDGQGRVFIVCPGGLENGGGIGRQMEYFLGALDPAGLRQRYVVIDSRGPWFLGTSRGKSFLSALYLLACIARLSLARFGRHPSLAHINITGRGSTIRKTLIALTAQLIGLRYVLHVHDYDYAADYAGRGKRQQSLVRRVFQGAQHVIVLGARDKVNLQSSLQIPASNLSIIPNAVPDPLPSNVGQDPRRPVHILFLGYLSERKGVSDLLQALGSELVKPLDWQATLAGGGDLDLYRGKASSLGLAHRVGFPGWLDRQAVAKSCRQADILVLPSYAEGLAMAVLEGLSYGLAVITTPVGAHAEVIEEGVSGLMLPPGDIAALAGALRRVIENPNFRRGLQRGARARFLEKFEASAYAVRLVALHFELMADAER